ncbi:MAG TPA: phospho-sugar mutase, partial [Candidatus Gemmiger avium]|nr:phospho-sugar mutase [Candidatus Gemmiger avium]
KFRNIRLDKIGVTDVTVVPEQEKPDGNFPTCPYPNPEIRQALEKGIALCEQVEPDLLLATDPDCDRVGIAVKDEGKYVLLTGNEVGVLLLDFICRIRKQVGTMPEKPVAVSTIVSTDMADTVAAKYGVELRRTLTGFKFIGEQIGLLEQNEDTDRYIFGFEESYGYLSGPHVRDKDGVNAAMLICQMAQYYKAQGKNLSQAMDDLYQEFGCYQNSLHSFAFEGQAGFSRMQGIMNHLRQTPPSELAGQKVEAVVDYASGVKDLPPANVLEFCLANGAKAMVRPSGTEPKMKVYLFARGRDRVQAQAFLSQMRAELERFLQ